MNIEELRNYCLSFNSASESFPFDESTLVFKVSGKIFCLVNLEGNLSFNIKNTPEKVFEMREQFSAVLPGYHMNKKYWNTVLVDGTIPKQFLQQWIFESYNEIIAKLPVKMQQELKNK